eukprot:scaffold128682_cov63-Phaeocystis_antarctica.AAC.7
MARISTDAPPTRHAVNVRPPRRLNAASARPRAARSMNRISAPKNVGCSMKISRGSLNATSGVTG